MRLAPALLPPLVLLAVGRVRAAGRRLVRREGEGGAAAWQTRRLWRSKQKTLSTESFLGLATLSNVESAAALHNESERPQLGSRQGRDRICKGRRRWLAQAPETLSDGRRAAFGLKDANCDRIDNVCIHQDGSLVVMAEHNLTDGPANILRKFQHGDREYKQRLNMPGYDDSTPGAQYDWRGTYVRTSGSLDPPELKLGWSRHSLHVPVLFFPTWFDNIGESMISSVLDLALHLQHSPVRDQSLLVGAPQAMLMPEWWKLLGGLVHSVRGLYETCLHCDDQPAPCFDHVFSCSALLRPPPPRSRNRFVRIELAGLRKVGEALTSMVGASCKEGGARARHAGSRDRTFRVWFDQRLKNRRILNLDELVRNCSKWLPEGYDRVVCRKQPIVSSFASACELNRFDVLVATHGAGIANGLFLRQGRGGVVEISEEGWAPPNGPKWGGTLYYDLFKHIPVRYFWYAVPAKDTRPGEIETCYRKHLCKKRGTPRRDKDLKVRWAQLRELLARVASGAEDGHGRSAEALLAGAD